MEEKSAMAKNFISITRLTEFKTKLESLFATKAVVTTSANGLMSSTDKSKLDGIDSGATKVTTDTVSGWGYTKNAGTITGIKMNGSSKGTSGVVDLGTVITAHQDISGKANTADLATVATSGSYNDLINKPTIPTVDSTLSSTSTNPVQNKVINNALSGKAASSHTHTKSDISDFPTLATVATSGSYNDLSNKPTIPTVNNGTLTIQKNGNDVATFGANQSTAATANITVPTKVSELTNDSGFTTNTGTITKVQANGTDVASSGTANIPAASTSAYGVTKLSDSVSSTSTSLAATANAVKTVNDKIVALGSPMHFKGSLGTNGTITDLPTASTSTIGDTYKVITAGTYASTAAKVGDVFTCNDTPAWVLIPSGDEPSGTVTSVTLKATSPIAIDSTSAITSSGTRTLSHANSGATAGSYGDSAAQTPAYGGTFKVPYVTVNETGHVTAISEHTVKIPASDNTDTHRPIQVNGTQALASNTTPLNLKAGSNVTITDGGSGEVTISATDTTYTASTTSIGSASAGTAISADDITAWTTNTPTAVTKKTVVTAASGATAAYADGILTLTNGSFSTGDSVSVTAGTAASLSYTAKSIPNISVSSKTVVTGITAS